MWQKVFIPHENVAKYFGAHPPLFHSAPVPGIKSDQSLTRGISREDSLIKDIFLSKGKGCTPNPPLLESSESSYLLTVLHKEVASLAKKQIFHTLPIANITSEQT